MKRKVFLATVCFLVITFVLMFIGCTHKDAESTSSNEGFFWDQDESELVDVKIVDDEVYLYYSLCFDNRNDDCSVQVSSVTGSFSKFDCKGWLKHQKAFVAETEDGQNGLLIPPKTKTSVVFVFQGEYLGGEIKEDMRLDTLVFLQNHIWSQSQ